MNNTRMLFVVAAAIGAIAYLSRKRIIASLTASEYYTAGCDCYREQYGDGVNTQVKVDRAECVGAGLEFPECAAVPETGSHWYDFEPFTVEEKA